MYTIRLCYLSLALSLSTLAFADTGLDDRLITKSFKISATIIKGCLLGSGSTSASSFGTISFGDISSLAQDMNVTSANNTGSIVIRCTPGIAVSISLDRGLNVSGTISAGRLLKSSSTSETLRYQLFQDDTFSTIWGDNNNGGTIKTTTALGTTQTFPIYARLFTSATLPSVGLYSDSVIVTITY